MAIDIILEKTKSRKFFYRDLYRKELTLLIILTIMACVWVVLIIWVATHRVVPSFYSSSSDGILTPLTVMSAPNRSNKVMLE